MTQRTKPLKGRTKRTKPPCRQGPARHAVEREYADALRRDAKERQREHGGTAPGKKKETLREFFPEVKLDDRRPRSIRAKAAGTNRTYMDLADNLAQQRTRHGEIPLLPATLSRGLAARDRTHKRDGRMAFRSCRGT